MTATAAPPMSVPTTTSRPAVGVPRDIGHERAEDGNAVRGLVFGVLFSLPIWGVIGLAVWGVGQLFAG